MSLSFHALVEDLKVVSLLLTLFFSAVFELKWLFGHPLQADVTNNNLDDASKASLQKSKQLTSLKL